ncbi:DUF1990 family protein [Rathayibacter toxicus]|uniref:DUF1990 family protein n=1 Tax=Rathayibacter toxicus TaxID=145458 RepID=UPI000B09413C|nr:DUF1990 domain-containing protein [Rathayibacter toxicus]
MSIRLSTFEGQPQVTYAAVGGTLAPDLLEYPPKGYRAERFEARLGSGNERFAVAAASLMTWGVQRGSGLQVTDISPGSGVHYTGVNFDADGTPIDLSSRPTEEHFAPDGTPYIAAGVTAVLTMPLGRRRVRAPVRVVYVLDEPDRVGFAYGTLEGHPASGEESFVVEKRFDESVWLVIRVFSRPASRLYRWGVPFLRVLQRRQMTRYLRALLPARVS